MKKILLSEQIKEVDAATIAAQRIPSHKLMERAAYAFVNAINWSSYQHLAISIFAGPGNNGGDALAVSRILLDKGIKNRVYLCMIGTGRSADCDTNLKRLQAYATAEIQEIYKEQDVEKRNGLVIDGIFGSGLNRPVTGYWATLLEKINEDADHIISIDIPSGYFADEHRDNVNCIRANHVISFELPKLSFMMPESQIALSSCEIVNIDLDAAAIDTHSSKYHLIEAADITAILQPKEKFSHKGSHGKACLVGGHSGMIGAIALAGKSAESAGCGYVYYQSHYDYNSILHMLHPSAIIVQKSNNAANAWYRIKAKTDYHYGIGCGMGQTRLSRIGLVDFLGKWKQAVVLDADALNILAKLKFFNTEQKSKTQKLDQLPPHSILTPHLKEFDRLFGEHKTHQQRIDTALKIAMLHQIYICIKGAHTAIICPNNRCIFNNTGNPGMAKAGSGDILTGMLCSFLAQGYTPEESCLLAVHLHGHAGDLAAKSLGEYGMSAEDIITFIPQAINEHLC